MKKTRHYLIYSWTIFSILMLYCYPAFSIESASLIPQVKVLVPGIRSTISITQNQPFPMDFFQIIVVALGNGILDITVRNDGIGEDLIILTGLGISSAGIVPIFKFGRGEQITVIERVDIGNEQSPYGLVWITSWLDSSVDEPPYEYTLTLNF